ncbi:MAG: peptide chain release factor 2 [Pseudomonadota bacterium]|nr:peptide chain release factor 2 [Pseudomonadota bacterium]
MRAEIQAATDEIESSLTLLRRHLEWDVALARLEDLNQRAEDPELWNDHEAAQAIMRERTRLDDKIGDVRSIEAEMADHLEMIALGEAEDDAETISEAETELLALRDRAAQKELESLLSGEADGNNAFLEVNAGAGGTEAQDWAEMLLRMYMRWAEKRGFTIDLVNRTDGEEAGIKSATLRINGTDAFGWIKTEAGVHRLVRISPYDSAARRHTSFAAVSVSPVIDDSVDVELKKEDIRIDTYRASGAGGQHINKTDSAVRMTHIPTGIVVACQQERSQHQNRAHALQMLRARLYEAELKKREAEMEGIKGEMSDIGWGHQIRSYVLHPYQMVKDLRTQVETGNTGAVLDGGIDLFISAALAARAGRNRADK